jgi:iron complex outermembrane receptor protein
LQASASYSQDIAYHPILNKFDSTDEYTLYNARASLSEVEFGSGKLRFDLWGNNITGEEVRGWGIDFGALGFAVNSYNELESYGLDVVFEF